MRCDVVQHVTQHLSLVKLDEPTLFQQHPLSHAIPRFSIIAEQYQSYIVLPLVGPHYTQPFRKLLGVFDVLEQLLAFLHRLHICATLHGLIYNSFNRKQNGVKL